jgi:hypothetical protein
VQGAVFTRITEQHILNSVGPQTANGTGQGVPAGTTEEGASMPSVQSRLVRCCAACSVQAHTQAANLKRPHMASGTGEGVTTGTNGRMRIVRLPSNPCQAGWCPAVHRAVFKRPPKQHIVSKGHNQRYRPRIASRHNRRMRIVILPCHPCKAGWCPAVCSVRYMTA